MVWKTAKQDLLLCSCILQQRCTSHSWHPVRQFFLLFLFFKFCEKGSSVLNLLPAVAHIVKKIWCAICACNWKFLYSNTLLFLALSLGLCLFYTLPKYFLYIKSLLLRRCTGNEWMPYGVCKCTQLHQRARSRNERNSVTLLGALSSVVALYSVGVVCTPFMLITWPKYSTDDCIQWHLLFLRCRPLSRSLSNTRSRLVRCSLW